MNLKLYPTNSNRNENSDRSTASKSIKPIKPSISSSRRSKSATPDQSKKYVTFSNNTEIVPHLRGLSSSAASEQSDSTKPDLPGRVSFSKNEVYEIDFSDYENETDTGRSMLDKSNESKPNEETKSLSQSPQKNEINDNKPNQFCCELKCNTMACSTDIPDKEPYDAAKFQDIDESSQIIEEYKKSIENINRQYQFDSKRSAITTDISSKLPFQNISDDLKTYQSKETIILPENSNDDEHIHESAEVEADQKLNEEIWFNVPSSNHHGDQALTLLDHRPNTTNSNASASKDSYKSSEVISNYLKETNKKINVKPRKQNTNNNSTQTPTSSRKVKSMNRIISGQNGKPTIKAKVNNHREESNIGEFQIDKVESWMSLHEKNFGKISDSKLDRYDNDDKDNSSVDWSLKTPRKSIDEDDQFFIDESIENGSMEESPYDEIVSIIKEIDEQKQLDLSEYTY